MTWSPAHYLDALDAKLRAAVQHADGDPGDNFMVWTDAIYGDRDGDGMSELAVSRIPDAKTPVLVRRLLTSGRSSSSGAGGVRKSIALTPRQIFRGLSGAAAAQLLVSEPTGPRDPQLANGVLAAPAVYLMLHGDYLDAQRFWGEKQPQQCVEAINVGNIPAAPYSVVFCGACWGALTVTQRAVDMGCRRVAVAAFYWFVDGPEFSQCGSDGVRRMHRQPLLTRGKRCHLLRCADASVVLEILCYWLVSG